MPEALFRDRNVYSFLPAALSIQGAKSIPNIE